MIIFVVVLMCILLVWIGRIFYVVHKGMNEIIKGLSSIDDRLAHLEEGLPSAEPSDGTIVRSWRDDRSLRRPAYA